MFCLPVPAAVVGHRIMDASVRSVHLILSETSKHNISSFFFALYTMHLAHRFWGNASFFKSFAAIYSKPIKAPNFEHTVKVMIAYKQTPLMIVSDRLPNTHVPSLTKTDND